MGQSRKNHQVFFPQKKETKHSTGAACERPNLLEPLALFAPWPLALEELQNIKASTQEMLGERFRDSAWMK